MDTNTKTWSKSRRKTKRKKTFNLLCQISPKYSPMVAESNIFIFHSIQNFSCPVKKALIQLPAQSAALKARNLVIHHYHILCPHVNRTQ